MRFALVLALWVTSLGAQDTSAFEVCGNAPSRQVDAAFYGEIVTVPQALMAVIDTQYLDMVLGLVRQSWRPEPMTLGTFRVDKRKAMPGGMATVGFTVARDGEIHDIGLAASSLSAPFDRAVLNALLRADSAKMLAPLPESALSQVKFFLTVYVAPYPEEPDTLHPWQPRGRVRPLIKTTLPEWDPPVAIPEPLPVIPPSYPEDARSQLVEDSLLVRFVIDEKGNVVPSTVFFLSGTYRVFAKSIRDWLPRARYRPARIHNCPVKSAVIQPYRYKINR
jgi:outer membrane biosynthesis protein TonB